MKKIVLTIVLFAAVSITTNAQILFGTAQTLKNGAFSIGIEPVWADYGGGDFAMFFHGGYGLGNSSDLGLKLGFGWSGTYVGLDYEKMFISGKPAVSGHIGAHYWNDFGLDFGAIVTFPIQALKLTTGLDMDLNFGEDANNDLELYAPVWLPISMEYYIKKNFSIVFEGNIKLTRTAFTTVGGGINVYF
ncbi:MAG: hypothetical protein L3J74_11925 [Bacteroidales bacterium]|nr:hypothetical protein [Bacteroidales bacterium]